MSRLCYNYMNVSKEAAISIYVSQHIQCGNEARLIVMMIRTNKEGQGERAATSQREWTEIRLGLLYN